MSFHKSVSPSSSYIERTVVDNIAYMKLKSKQIHNESRIEILKEHKLLGINIHESQNV